MHDQFAPHLFVGVSYEHELGRGMSNGKRYPIRSLFDLSEGANLENLPNFLGQVMSHAREEYLFQLDSCPIRPDREALTSVEIRLSIYVLESSNSRRLTHFLPPLVSSMDLPGFSSGF